MSAAESGLPEECLNLGHLGLRFLAREWLGLGAARRSPMLLSKVLTFSLSVLIYKFTSLNGCPKQSPSANYTSRVGLAGRVHLSMRSFHSLMHESSTGSLGFS